jgi:hypothetical protein
MAKKQEEVTKMPKRKEVVGAEPTPNILLQEYNSLVSLYTHSENTLFSIFNFYVTLLTTITGAIIVIFQLGGKNAGNPSGVILLLLVFIVLIGIITQDALIHKNGDLAHFALALNAVKSYVLRNYPDTHAHIFYMWDLHTRVNPLDYKISLDEKVDKFLWWMLPIGMPQLFVTLMNSFALASLVIVLTVTYGGNQVHALKFIVAILLVIVFSFIAHCTYANIKFRHKVKRFAMAMDGQLQEWIK